MKLKLLVIAASGVLVAFLSAGCADAQRKIDEYGTGNCIFAPVVLPYNKEGSAPYKKVTDTFQAEEVVYSRCYFNGTIESYKKHGKVFNSLRDEGEYSYNLYWVRPRPDGSLPDDSGLKEITAGRRVDATNSWDWDGRQFRFGNDKDCDLKVPLYDRERLKAYPNKCLNLVNAARFMERKSGLAPQKVAKFCLRVRLIASDTKRWTFNNDSWSTSAVKDFYPMAGGCFTVELPEA